MSSFVDAAFTTQRIAFAIPALKSPTEKRKKVRPMKNDLTVGGELSERKKMILRSVIESHIATGEPIGSKALMTKSDIPYSSATIRNEMADLENMGYLVQPHTSAGRVPTRLGYRFYVDALMESYQEGYSRAR